MARGFDFALALGALLVVLPIACYVCYRIGRYVGRRDDRW